MLMSLKTFMQQMNRERIRCGQDLITHMTCLFIQLQLSECMSAHSRSRLKFIWSLLHQPYWDSFRSPAASVQTFMYSEQSVKGSHDIFWVFLHRSCLFGSFSFCLCQDVLSVSLCVPFLFFRFSLSELKSFHSLQHFSEDETIQLTWWEEFSSSSLCSVLQLKRLLCLNIMF